MENKTKNNNNVKLTYETLFEILRIEKSRGELQELDTNFITNVKEYLFNKCLILNKTNAQSNLFGEAEKLKTLNELSNIKRIIQELYQKRENKIIHLVINKSRTNSNLIDSTNLLPEEKPLHDSLLNVLNKHRVGILHNILDTNNSSQINNSTQSSQINNSTQSNNQNNNINVQQTNTNNKPININIEPNNTNNETNIRTNNIENQNQTNNIGTQKNSTNLKNNLNTNNPDKETIKALNEQQNNNEKKLIRFVKEVTPFIGKELESYGPFQPDDIANLPIEIANILINKGNAEEVKS